MDNSFSHSPLLTAGFYGGELTAFITILAIFRDPVYLAGFIAGYFFNKWLNGVLKSAIRDERPSNPILFYGGEKGERWGFPSGHTQMAAYSFVFLLLSAPKRWELLLLSGTVVILTAIQRYMYNQHTPIQLIAGLFVGAFVAGIFVFLLSRWRQ
jgi:membrane-associated phospholipid phosphatase